MREHQIGIGRNETQKYLRSRRTPTTRWGLAIRDIRRGRLRNHLNGVYVG